MKRYFKLQVYLLLAHLLSIKIIAILAPDAQLWLTMNALLSGELEYITDMIGFPGQLFAEFVRTQAVALSTIANVDATEALVSSC